MNFLTAFAALVKTNQESTTTPAEREANPEDSGLPVQEGAGGYAQHPR